jgi:hypothetical protein
LCRVCADAALNELGNPLGQVIPFFFKQWGGVNKKVAGKILDGRVWDAIPKGPAVNRPTERVSVCT